MIAARRLALLIVAAVVLCATAGISARAETKSLWLAAIAANPEVQKCESFYKAYSDVMDGRLKGFRHFVEALEGKSTCDRLYLCRAHVVPEFVPDRATPCTDLIRYAFTSTCAGFLPDDEHRVQALKTLDQVIEKLDVSSLPIEEKRYVRKKLGPILKTLEPGKFPSKSRFKNILKRWQDAYVDKDIMKPDPLSQAEEVLARAACSLD